MKSSNAIVILLSAIIFFGCNPLKKMIKLAAGGRFEATSLEYTWPTKIDRLIFSYIIHFWCK